MAEPDDTACVTVVGGGCFGARAEVSCDAPTGAGDTGTCADCDEAWVGGGPVGCATGPGGPGGFLLILLVMVARTAFAVDVEELDLGEGGEIPGVVDPAAPPPWTPRVAVGASHAADPVRLRVGDLLSPLVTSLDTVEVTGSLQVKDWFRAGITVPGHRVLADGEPEVGPGDVRLFLVAPLGPRLAVTTSLEAAPNGSPDFAHQVSTTLGLTTRRDLAFLTVAGSLRARLEQTEDLPGVRWGHRLEAAVGARSRGRLGAGVVGLAGAPLTLVLAPPAGAWPVEGLAFGAARLAPGVHLDAGGGAGVTWGLGSPAWRAFAVIRVEGRLDDRDADGIADLPDRCPEVPEDRDGYHDHDGCPDPDNDQDGLVDAEDGCPDDAEVVNGFDDADGCPDALARWRVVVVTEQPAEQLRIAVDGAGDWQLATERELEIVPGAHHLEVEAADHRPYDAVAEVPPGESTVTVHLEALHLGVVRVTLVDPDRRPLAGQVKLDGDAWDVPEAGAALTLPWGTGYGLASAAGHLPETVEVRVGVEPADVVVVLEPVPSRVAEPPVLFALDSADLAPTATDLLDRLATWLRTHPGVSLLRIEGHADALGSPAYNYGLSVLRADAVRRALVARGIVPVRLDAVGSGEARSELVGPSFDEVVAGVPAREVSFRVLVWDEASAARVAPDHALPGP